MPFEKLSDFILVSVLFFIALLISTVGQIPQSLSLLAPPCGVLLIAATVFAFYSFGKRLRLEWGFKLWSVWLFVILIHLFWAIVRAPLDVDGIFYHLTIILDALQQNRWGEWQFPLWQIQTAPKLGVIPNLTLVALGGEDFGYRLAQLGHFSSGILGALAFTRLGENFGLSRSSLLGLMYLLTPIVVKQMTGNYVDLAFHSYWLMAAAALTEISGGKRFWIWPLGLCAFLLTGTKINGFAAFFALLPFVFILSKKSPKLAHYAVIVSISFIFLSASFWMIPNWNEWNNPIFPLNPNALIPGSGVSLVPDETPVTGLHGKVGEIAAPSFIKWILLFFIMEPIAQYDNNGGAWGFLGIWAILTLLFTWAFDRRRPLAGMSVLGKTFFISLLILFLINPGRVVPRYSMLSGFLFIFPALDLYLRGEIRPFLKTAFLVALLIQIPYISGERVLLRGLDSPNRFFEVVSENFKDVLIYGEPQSPDRWMHYPYVPDLRKNEPRIVEVGKDCVSLTALYWGRTFANKVHVTPECCFWPYCSEKVR